MILIVFMVPLTCLYRRFTAECAYIALFHTSVLGSVLNTEQTLLTFTALNIYSSLPEHLVFCLNNFLSFLSLSHTK